VPSMPQPQPAGQPDTRDQDVVLGVDTHKDIHVAAVLSALGVLLGSATFPTTAAGYRQLLAWARGFGPLRLAGVEGTGSYGKALTRYLRGRRHRGHRGQQPGQGGPPPAGQDRRCRC
jgi:transposase